jgi:hypothetical protein
MGQREQTYKVRLIQNPDTPFSKVRTLFTNGKDADKVKSKVKKLGRIISCEKYKTGGFFRDTFFRKAEFIDKKKGDQDDSLTLSEAIEFNNRIVIEDGFTLNKSMRLARLERNKQEKEEQYLDDILGGDE